MASFDIALPSFGGADNILTSMNAWMSGLTAMGELEWIGLITIGLGVIVVIMALTGASAELAKGRVSGQYG